MTEQIRIKCRKCSIEDIALFEQMRAQMPEYIKTVGEALRVSDEEYKKRLELCSECEGLAGGLICRHCGCFVQMRALKNNSHCPNPSASGRSW